MKAIEEPLPLLSKNIKNFTLTDNAPKLYANRSISSDSIGVVAGKPERLLVINERDILTYLKQAFSNNSLVYCK